MTKINNKAFTVVELIITFSIVMVISVGLFKVLDSYREKQQQESYRKMINNYKNEITKTIKDDILKLGIKKIEGITCTGYNQGINITFNDDSKKDLCVGAEGEDNGIKYGDIFYKVPSKFIKFKDDFLFEESGEFEVPQVNTLGLSEEKILTEQFYTIKIKMNHTELKEDFDINIVGSKKSNKKLTKIANVDTVDGFNSNTFIGELDLQEMLKSDDEKKCDECEFSTKYIETLKIYSYDYNYVVKNGLLNSILENSTVNEMIIGDTDKSNGQLTLNGLINLDLSNVGIIRINKKSLELNTSFLNNITSDSGINELDLTGIELDKITLSGKFQNLKIKKLYITTDLYNKDIFKNCEVDELVIKKGTSDTLNNISDDAFTKIRKLTLEEGIVIINDKAFDNYQIEEVKFPSTLEEIMNYPFANNLIKKVDFPNKLKTLRDSAFKNNSIKELDFTNITISSWNYAAFLNNPIKKVTCGNSESFCNSLTSTFNLTCNEDKSICSK